MKNSSQIICTRRGFRDDLVQWSNAFYFIREKDMRSPYLKCLVQGHSLVSPDRFTTLSTWLIPQLFPQVPCFHSSSLSKGSPRTVLSHILHPLLVTSKTLWGYRQECHWPEIGSKGQLLARFPVHWSNVTAEQYLSHLFFWITPITKLEFSIDSKLQTSPNSCVFPIW